jgi:DNA-binding response OmpR family regulator
VQEDGRSSAGLNRIVVVADDHDAIIEAVIAPEPLGAAGVGQAHGLIVGRISRRVAPAVLRLERAGVESREGPTSIRAVEKVSDRPNPDRRRAVAFLLGGRFNQPASAQGAARPAPIDVEGAIAIGNEYRQALPATCFPPYLRVGLPGASYSTMAQPKTILIVDDDADLRGALAEQLALNDEFRVVEAGTGAQGVTAARSNQADLILLDVDLPDGDGRDISRQLRTEGVGAPIIMLTASDSEDDTIQGLDAGANDYVTKPFRFGVLLARIRAHLRSHEQSEAAVFRIGPYEFRPSAKLLIDERQKKIRLTEKEANILKYLYRAGQKPVPREELLTEVWGYNAGVTTHTLETHVYRLRQKIESDPGHARLLLTESGGYRLQP